MSTSDYSANYQWLLVIGRPPITGNARGNTLGNQDLQHYQQLPG